MPIYKFRFLFLVIFIFNFCSIEDQSLAKWVPYDETPELKEKGHKNNEQGQYQQMYKKTSRLKCDYQKAKCTRIDRKIENKGSK